MPRIKAPPQPAIPSLDGVTVTFASFQPSALTGTATPKTVALLKPEIARCGGSYTTKVEQCTHMVATPSQYEKQITRINEATQYPNIVIVSYDWLTASVASNAPVDVEKYLLDTSATNGINGTSDTESQLVQKPAKKTSSKRRRQDDDDDDVELSAPVKKSKSSSKTKSKDEENEPVATTEAPKRMNVPVDEYVPSPASYQVYVDDTGMVYDATLNKSDAGANNNKFYRIQILNHRDSYSTWTRWGRVGERGQSKMLGDDSLEYAVKEFKSKFKDKSGLAWENRDGPSKKGKYIFLEINYEQSDDEGEKATPKRSISKDTSVEHETVKVESKLEPQVQRLMELIFNLQLFNNTMAELEYDANKMPLGKLSKKTLLKGYEVLKELASLVVDPSLAATKGETHGQAITDRSNRYFSLVPHVTGRKALPVLKDMDSIKREIQLLETLTDMQLANEIMKSASVEKHKQVHVLDRQYQGLSMEEMTPLNQDSQEFTEIFNYLNKSTGSTHGITYDVQDIFRIERQGESDRFSQSPYTNLGSKSDRRLLWHGSRCTNFGGILSQGLRIAPPEAPVSGYMFGKGVYLADMSSKSANYCAAYNSGGTALLLLCEAELGAPALKLTDADYNAGTRAKENDCISTWGLGKTGPQAWKDASCIHPSLKGVKMPNVVSKPPGATKEPNAYLLYNEYIVYDVAQIKLRYLLRVKMN